MKKKEATEVEVAGEAAATQVSDVLPLAPHPQFAPAPLPLPKQPERHVDPLAESLAEALADGIWTGNATSPRSLQTALGFSQLGGECDRRRSHHLRGTRTINHPDPLRSIIGLGVHLILADYWRRLDAGTGRYLVEQPLLWQGIPGTVDLFDRRRKVVIDWKTTDLAKLAQIKARGPTKTQVVQVMGYGAALRASGEAADHVALAFIPIDGALADIWVWRSDLNVSIAQDAINRLSRVAHESFPATPSPGPLCGWCPFHRPGTTDLTVSCPGKD